MNKHYVLIACVFIALAIFFGFRNSSLTGLGSRADSSSERDLRRQESDRLPSPPLEEIHAQTLHAQGLRIIPDNVTIVDSLDPALMKRIKEEQVSRGGGIVLEPESKGVEHWLEGWLRIVRSEWLDVGAMAPVGFSDEEFFYYSRTKSGAFESGYAINKQTGFIERWNFNEEEDPNSLVAFPR